MADLNQQTAQAADAIRAFAALDPFFLALGTAEIYLLPEASLEERMEHAMPILGAWKAVRKWIDENTKERTDAQ